MNAKMKECFTPHAFMHNLMGLGVGLLLASLVSGLANMWLGLALIVIAMVTDSMRK